MRTLHLSHDDYLHLQRTLLSIQHFLCAFDQTEVTQEGQPYLFEAGGYIKALDRALEAIGWRPGDPMPSGLWFEFVSPHPLDPKKPQP